MIRRTWIDGRHAKGLYGSRVRVQSTDAMIFFEKFRRDERRCGESGKSFFQHLKEVQDEKQKEREELVRVDGCRVVTGMVEKGFVSLRL